MHGLTDDESVWASTKHCASYGELLERDAGVTCVYVRYNTGLHVSTNGRRLCDLLDEQLEQFCRAGVVNSVITFICHSMSGLVTRSACLQAVQKNRPNADSASTSTWVHHVGRIIFLGTPHHGSFWEQLGNVVATGIKQVPYMGSVVADVANVRSAGIKDLRYGYLQDEDWQGRDPDAYLTNWKRPAELLPWVNYYIASGTVMTNPHNPISYLVGDALVRKDSAHGRSKSAEHSLEVPPDNIREFPGVGHLRLPNHCQVYEQIKEWMDQPCRLPIALVTTDQQSPEVTPNHSLDQPMSPSKSRDDTATTKLPTTTTTTTTTTTRSTWAQAKGATTLLETAVDRGATAVEEIQDRITKHVYDVVAVVVPGARTVETIHGTISKSVFGAIRLVNYGVGTVAKLTFATLDDCSSSTTSRRHTRTDTAAST
jgi:triacylglycerol lipase